MDDSYATPLGLYVEGEWLGAEGRRTHRVLNPASGQGQADLPLADAADLDRALTAAERGFRAWRIAGPEVRSGVLTRAASLIRERADAIARVVTLEQGKPLAEARGEVLAAAALTDFHAAEAVRVYGRVLMRPAGTRSLVLHQPIGPVAAFCAWNFPALNPARKLAPAIAAGCSIILKPSEETPGSAVEVMRCFADAGLPGDVAQLVFGVPSEVSARLLASPLIRKLSFTGSVPVGKELLRLAADTVKRTTMELGGHAPVLVFDDCDLERTLDVLVANKFRNAGQVCVSPTRFHVQEGIYDAFAEGFAARTRRLRLGSGLAADTSVGPMANPRRPEAIEALVEDARAAGARVLAGGGRLRGGDGFFFEPTVLADVPMTARAMHDEPFGPVALLHPFTAEDVAVAEANRLPFGLAAYCFTESGRRQDRLSDTLEAGMVAINQARLTWPDSPFGGVKESGYGSEDGPEGILAHCVTKSVHVG